MVGGSLVYIRQVSLLFLVGVEAEPVMVKFATHAVCIITV
jgi:hypothetical protein